MTPQPFLYATQRQERDMASFLVRWTMAYTDSLEVEGLKFMGTWEGDEYGVVRI